MATKELTVQISVRLTEAEVEHLDIAADAENRSRSSMIRALVLRGLGTREPIPRLKGEAA